MTPVFFNPLQDVGEEWISMAKIPEFVGQIGRDYTRSKVATLADVSTAHDWVWAMDVNGGDLSNGFGNKSGHVMNYVMASVGSFISAADFALEHNTVACSASQGFHHASYASCYGFCTFNGLMIAAVRQLRKGVPRVMIVDGDGHYGDGTDDIRQRLRIETKVSHITRNMLGVPRHANWESSLWAAYFKDLIREHSPGIIYYQAGADAWLEDPFGAGYLSKDGLAYRDRGLFQAAKKEGVPVVWNLAGGYADPMQLTIDLHLQTLKISDEVYHGTADSTKVPPQRTEIIR